MLTSLLKHSSILIIFLVNFFSIVLSLLEAAKNPLYIVKGKYSTVGVCWIINAALEHQK
jgi:hypothetical protein